MKVIGLFSFFAAFVFSLSAFSAAPSTVDFSKINLEGLKVLDKDGVDNFQYLLKLLAKPSSNLVKTLEDQSNSKIVSPIFELNQVSAFKNIYVYVGLKDDGGFELVEVLLNSKGGYFVIDMDITDVTKTEMKMQNGPNYERENFTATRSPEALFQ